MTTYSSLHYAEVARRLAGGTADEIAEIQGYESLPAKSAKEYAEEAKTYATPIGFIGEIVATFCSDTYTPEGCLPCDGTEYTKASFPSLWSNYLTGDAPNLLTCTYEEYTTSITTYGSCAKFAVDSTNEKFKVPTIPDGDVIAQASSDDEVGKSYNAGLPNIEGLVPGGPIPPDSDTGAFEKDTANGTVQGGTYAVNDWKFDASLSNDIYGNSDTVTPQQVRLRHFVVVAFGTQNESQMDWSEWATSLSGKANNDLTNVTAPTQAFKDMSVGWGMPDYSAGIQITLPYTTPSRGILHLRGYILNDYWEALVNGLYIVPSATITEGYGVAGGSNSNVDTLTLILDEGDVISTVYGQCGGMFYPLKGVATSD